MVAEIIVRGRIDRGGAAVTIPVGWFTQTESAVPLKQTVLKFFDSTFFPFY